MSNSNLKSLGYIGLLLNVAAGILELQAVDLAPQASQKAPAVVPISDLKPSVKSLDQLAMQTEKELVQVGQDLGVVTGVQASAIAPEAAAKAKESADMAKANAIFTQNSKATEKAQQLAAESLKAIEKQEAVVAADARGLSSATPVNNGLLIFLGDSEYNTTGFLTTGLLSAISQEAGPIIASATLLANLMNFSQPSSAAGPDAMINLYDRAVCGARCGMTAEESDSVNKDFLFSAVNFPVAAAKWIIKEVNPNLYLLIPKKYLVAKRINQKSVESVTTGSLTAAELALGLKVNHLRTISVADIKKSDPEPNHAPYFMPGIWHEASHTSPIFVTNQEYHEQSIAKKSLPLPIWAIYITGHGGSNVICNLELSDFQKFLNFLEKNIYTKLLYYNTCFGAGLNEQTIYGDVKKGITQTYSYAIITQALTDAITFLFNPTIILDRHSSCPNFLCLKTDLKYDAFLEQVTKSDLINYREIVTPISPDLTVYGMVGSLPQIKFPGLEWFSVVDSDKVIAIGSILAKTRTEPLNIASFFAKKDVKMAPLAILLYAMNIPFEIILDAPSSADFSSSPSIVSMIPGPAQHNFTKVSSQRYGIDKILNSFMVVQGLKPEKIFTIDLLKALPCKMHLVLDSAAQESKSINIDTLQHVLIHLTKEKNTVYMPYQDKLYLYKFAAEDIISKISYYSVAHLATDSVAQLATTSEAAEYENLRRKVADKELIVKNQSITELQKNIADVFAQSMDQARAEKLLYDLLNAMPNNTALRIPKILLTEGSAYSLLFPFSYAHIYANIPKVMGQHKIIGIDSVKGPIDSIYDTYSSSNDVVLDVSNHNIAIANYGGDVRVAGLHLTSDQKSDLEQNYTRIYGDIFTYAAAHDGQIPGTKAATVDQRSVHEMITPEHVAKIREISAKKAAEAAEAAAIAVIEPSDARKAELNSINSTKPMRLRVLLRKLQEKAANNTITLAERGELNFLQNIGVTLAVPAVAPVTGPSPAPVVPAVPVVLPAPVAPVAPAPAPSVPAVVEPSDARKAELNGLKNTKLMRLHVLSRKLQEKVANNIITPAERGELNFLQSIGVGVK